MSYVDIQLPKEVALDDQKMLSFTVSLDRNGLVGVRTGTDCLDFGLGIRELAYLSVIAAAIAFDFELGSCYDPREWFIKALDRLGVTYMVRPHQSGGETIDVSDSHLLYKLARLCDPDFFRIKMDI